MPTFILDFIADGAVFVAPPPHALGEVWLQFHADGVERPFATPRVAGAERMEWGTCIRFVLSLRGLDGGHLRAGLFCAPQQGAPPILLALAQVRLSELPLGRPRRLTFPLLSAANCADAVVELSLTATISMYDFARNTARARFHTQPRRAEREPRPDAPAFGTYNGPRAQLPHLAPSAFEPQTMRNRVHVISSQQSSDSSDRDQKNMPTIRRFAPL